MRWVLITVVSLATGVLAVGASLVVFVTSLSIYTRYVSGHGSNGAVGWDVTSIFGQHWKVPIIGILLGMFLFGVSAGLLLFSQTLHREAFSQKTLLFAHTDQSMSETDLSTTTPNASCGYDC